MALTRLVRTNHGDIFERRNFFQPMEVYVDDEAKLTLHGLQQHYVKLKDAEKNRKLFELLDVLEFNQVHSIKVQKGRKTISKVLKGAHFPILNYLNIMSVFSVIMPVDPGNCSTNLVHLKRQNNYTQRIQAKLVNYNRWSSS